MTPTSFRFSLAQWLRKLLRKSPRIDETPLQKQRQPLCLSFLKIV